MTPHHRRRIRVRALGGQREYARRQTLRYRLVTYLYDVLGELDNVFGWMVGRRNG
jgi:hypothetical protein